MGVVTQKTLTPDGIDAVEKMLGNLRAACITASGDVSCSTTSGMPSTTPARERERSHG